MLNHAHDEDTCSNHTSIGEPSSCSSGPRFGVLAVVDKVGRSFESQFVEFIFALLEEQK